MAVLGLLYINYAVFDFFETYLKQLRISVLEQVIEKENTNWHSTIAFAAGIPCRPVCRLRPCRSQGHPEQHRKAAGHGSFLDLSGCPALEEVYLSGTGAGSCTG